MDKLFVSNIEDKEVYFNNIFEKDIVSDDVGIKSTLISQEQSNFAKSQDNNE